MILFWAIASAMLLAALCFLLPPLARRAAASASLAAQPDSLEVEVYRAQRAELDSDLASGTIDSTQHGEALRALQRRIVEELAPRPERIERPVKSDKMAVVTIAVALPLAAVSLYLVLGNPDALSPQPAAADAHHAVTPEQIVAMVEGLAARMQQNPNDAPGWSMLARSYAVLERYDEAVGAYAKAVQLLPRDAQLHADYADVLGMTQGRSLAGKPSELIETALRLDPSNQKALALAGTAAFNGKQSAAAIEHWQRLLRTLPEDSDPARAVAASIAEARAALSAVPSASAATNAVATSQSQARISGSVRLQSDLANKVAPTDTLFIYARAVEGPKMPLAVLRAPAADFPRPFSLDESMAMSAALSLANYPRVSVVARVSKTGAANARSGDLESLPLSVEVGSSNVQITIDRVVP